MTLYQFLTLLFGTGIFSTVIGYILSRIKANARQTEAVQRGVQALLRDRLIAEYNKYSEQGCAPIYARDNFDNMWTQYHNLGKNGVMDDIHDKFMALPTEKEAG